MERRVFEKTLIGQGREGDLYITYNPGGTGAAMRFAFDLETTMHLIDATLQDYGKRSLRSDVKPIWAGVLVAFDQTGPPMTVRQVFYRLVSMGVIKKDENEYQRVGRQLQRMRWLGVIPFSFIADATRWVHKDITYSSMNRALKRTQENYRRSLLDAQDAHIEIWLEKETLAGFLMDVTNEYDVPLMVAHGFSSDTYIYSAAEDIRDSGKPAFIYYFSDYDPSGCKAVKSVRSKLHRLGADFNLVVSAVTEQQIQELNLQTRPTKRQTKRGKRNPHYSGDCRTPVSVELDAMLPADLKAICRQAIEQHIDQDELARLKAIEKAEKQSLAEYLGEASIN
jgi:hypothetical protein